MTPFYEIRRIKQILRLAIPERFLNLFILTNVLPTSRKYSSDFMENVYKATKMCGICPLKRPDSHTVYVTVYSWENTHDGVPAEAYFCAIIDPVGMSGKVVEAYYDTSGFVHPKRKSDMDKAEIVQLPGVLESVVQSGQITDITGEDFDIVKKNCYRPKEP